MGRNFAETVMGGMVLAVAMVFLYFFVNTAQISAVEGYSVSAAFAKIGGLQKGSDVRISGINVGTVISSGLDSETYDAVIKLSIEPSVKLPKDTVAMIASEGMIGGKYVRLRPGSSKSYIQLTRQKILNRWKIRLARSYSLRPAAIIKRNRPSSLAISFAGRLAS